jgi:hypothetical protein
MKQLTFNMNHFIRFKPTPEALAWHREYYRETAIKLHMAPPELTVYEDGYAEIAFWSFASIFGPHLHCGGPLAAVDNKFTIVVD